MMIIGSTTCHHRARHRRRTRRCRNVGVKRDWSSLNGAVVLLLFRLDNAQLVALTVKLANKSKVRTMAYTLSPRWELFVDDALIDDMTDSVLALRPPTRKNVAFIADAEWEPNNFSFWCVVDDKKLGIIRAYCRTAHVDSPQKGQLKNGVIRQTEGTAASGLDALALAESHDGGRTFERVPIGRCEYNGSTDNNIIAFVDHPNMPAAFIDTNPACPPEQRYKAFGFNWQKLYALYSADGIDWHMMDDKPLAFPGHFDSVNIAFWDHLEQCYRSFTRYYENMPENATDEDVLGPTTTAIRSIQSARSDDFINWTTPVPHRYADSGSDTQLYTLPTVPCPGAEHILLSFPARYIQHRIFDANHPWPGVSDGLFMASRDGVNWTRYLDAWVRPGLDRANWTERNNYISAGLVETAEDEWSLYINEHFRQPDQPVQIRRLAIEPRRFVSVQAKLRGGRVTTKPLLVNGNSLRLNYSTSAAGCVRVEIQDENGTAIPGFCLDEMEPVFGDSLDHVMTWNGCGDLSPLSGKTIRLQFHLEDADIFAFAVK